MILTRDSIVNVLIPASVLLDMERIMLLWFCEEMPFKTFLLHLSS